MNQAQSSLRILVAAVIAVAGVLSQSILIPSMSVRAVDPRPGQSCDEADEGSKELSRVPSSGKLADDGSFSASIRIIQIECKEIDGGTKEIEDPPGSGNIVVIELPDRHEWRRVGIDLPIPKGKVRLEQNQYLVGDPARLKSFYDRTCEGTHGWGWQSVYREPDEIDRPPAPQPQVFKTRLVWRWDGQDVVGGGRLVCEPGDTAVIQTHVLEEGKNGVLVQFPQNAGDYDIAARVAAAVRGLPFERIQVGANPVGKGLSGLPTYYWLDGSDQPPFNGLTVTVGPSSAPLTAFIVVWPVQGTWQWGDNGPPLSTANRGLPWPRAEVASGVPAAGAIAYTYQRDSSWEPGGAYLVRATVNWSGRWALQEDNSPPPYSPVLLSLTDNLPVFAAPPVTVTHARPYVVQQARALLEYATPTPEP